MKYDKSAFKDIKKTLSKLESEREKAIRASRDVIMLSKKIIYSVHREDMKSASSSVRQIKSKLLALKKIGFKKFGMSKVAYQEYVEAVCYYSLIKTKTLPTPKALGVMADDYLLGLADLAGELVRRAVSLATKKKLKDVEEIRKFLSDLHYEFLQYDLRDSELRKKADSIRWNLRKIEDVVFSASLNGK